LPKVLIHNILLVFIILITLFVRSINIGKFGIYGDEKYSVMVMNGISWEGATQKEIFKKDENGTLIRKYFTPKQFWAALSFSDFDEAIMRTDNGNSSTYYLLLKFWKTFFGQTDDALRWMGVLFDCFTIILLFLFCKNILKQPVVGLIAGFFASIEPFMLAYSHQVRNYPVGIFLTFLSAYLFFKILQSEPTKKPNLGLYFAYGATILMGILCHFYIAFFVFSQFILLIYRFLKDFIILKRFIITYTISFLFLGLWFTIGSGRNTISTFKEKDEIYRNMAVSQSGISNDLSYVKKASFANIYEKIKPIFIDNFLVINDIDSKLGGNLNLLICIALTVFLVVLLDVSRVGNGVNQNLKYIVFLVVLFGIFYWFFSHNPLYYIYLSIVLGVFFLVIRNYFQFKNIFWEYTFFTIFIPTIITILMALKAGHTANIYQKYLSFGLPVAFIFMAYGLKLLYDFGSYISFIFIGIMGIYLINIFKIDKEILKDNYPKYTIIAQPRQPNPYITLANKIISTYQPGDTIIYPNTGHSKFDKFDAQMKDDYVSIIDAQMTNVYLPKNADYIQRVDSAEPDKVLLFQLKTQKKIVIFDFEGNKFRY
jgi:uncharacterized membrane protein